MATRKTKRFDEGGVAEGANSGIDDDIRSRAMKFAQDREENPGMYEAEPESPKTPAKPKAKPVAAKATAPAKAEPAPKKLNILEEAKAEARRRASGAAAVSAAKAQADRPKMTVGSMPKRGAGLSALAGMKKGGSVKGWGQARGARKAKMY